MLTYVVQRGDSLYTIASRLGTTVAALMAANHLTSYSLYVGQKLIIPVPVPYVYTVHAGDTLQLISLRFGTTVEALMLLNKLTSSMLYIGQKLRIPIYTEVIVNVDTANVRGYASTAAPVIAQMVRNSRLPATGMTGDWLQVRLFNGRTGWIFRDIVQMVPHDGERPIQEIFSYYTEQESPTLPGSYQAFLQHIDQQSNVGMFHFRIARQNPTHVEKENAFDDTYMHQVVAFGHTHNVKMLATIHNMFYTAGNNEINKEVIRHMLATSASRRAFIHNLIRVLQTYGFDGVNIDFEQVRYEDRELFWTFFKELGPVLRNNGYYYSAAVIPRISDDPSKHGFVPFNYALIGAAVDELVVMLYNEHGWPGSGPGPVVSIGWMQTVLRYALTKVPAGKITAAVPLFGFDFNLESGQNTYITYNTAIALAKKYNKSIVFDTKSQTPMFAYTDEAGNRHEVWFENAASLRAKLQMAHRLGIRGLALWRLGMGDPEIWSMLSTDFVVKKSGQ